MTKYQVVVTIPRIEYWDRGLGCSQDCWFLYHDSEDGTLCVRGWGDKPPSGVLAPGKACPRHTDYLAAAKK